MPQHKAFVDWLILYRDLKASTVRHHSFRSKRLFTYLGDTEFSQETVIGYLRYLKVERSYKSSSLKAMVKTIRLVIKYMVEEKGCVDFSNDLPRFREQPPHITPLTIDEIEAILSTEGKYQLVLELLARTGRRINEVLNLVVENIDFSAGHLMLPDTKTNRSLISPLPKDLVEDLRVHCSDKRPTEYIFTAITKRNSPISPPVIRRELKRRAEKAGVSKRVYPHLFRHSLPAEMLRRGADPKSVSLALGHSSLAQTERYTHFNTDDVKMALDHHPLNMGQMGVEILIQNLRKTVRKFQKLSIPNLEVKYSETSNSFKLEVKW